MIKSQNHITMHSESYRISPTPVPLLLTGNHFYPFLVHPCPLMSLDTSVMKPVLFSDP